MKTPQYWTIGGDIHIIMDSKVELLEEYRAVHNLPEGTTIHLYGWVRPTIDIDNVAEATLEYLLEQLDEEFANPDGDFTQPTGKMIQAAKEFIATIADEYTDSIWTLEKVCEEDVVL